MSVLPNQKLTMSELCISIGAGLMLYLLPNDAESQTISSSLAEGMVFIAALAITVALFLIVKRYQAVGAAILSCSSITVAAFIIDMIKGIFTKGSDYWPGFTEYRLITMFLLWTLPFFTAVFIRLLSHGSMDTAEARIGFNRFLSFSLRALMMIYILVIIFQMLLPSKPNMTSERMINFVPFGRITECLNGVHENGTMYLLWHSLILAPLTFSLLILNPNIKLWHLLIISASAGLTIEVIQYSFNTAAACLDDMMMYLIGAAVGIVLKRMIDKIRNITTAGEEYHMLHL